LHAAKSKILQAARTDMTHVRPEINLSTLIMIGENDNFTSMASSKIMNERIKNSELKIISEAGHVSNLENTDEFNRYLLERSKIEDFWRPKHICVRIFDSPHQN
jgi:pimeloyl-ACP methyl ester carboxylesterase